MPSARRRSSALTAAPIASIASATRGGPENPDLEIERIAHRVAATRTGSAIEATAAVSQRQLVT